MEGASVLKPLYLGPPLVGMLVLVVVMLMKDRDVVFLMVGNGSPASGAFCDFLRGLMTHLSDY